MAAILFICNANMCRSPMAEGIMRQKLIQNGLDHIAVASMGIHAHEGNYATDLAVAVCNEASIDIGRHRSRPLIPGELKISDLIFTMEPVQSEYLNLFFPLVSDRVFMLAAWPDRKKKKATISDPVGKPITAYRKTFQILQHSIDSVLPDLFRRYNTSAKV